MMTSNKTPSTGEIWESVHDRSKVVVVDVMQGTPYGTVGCVRFRGTVGPDVEVAMVGFVRTFQPVQCRDPEPDGTGLKCLRTLGHKDEHYAYGALWGRSSTPFPPPPPLIFMDYVGSMNESYSKRSPEVDNLIQDFVRKFRNSPPLSYYGLKPEQPKPVYDLEARWADPEYRARYCGLKK